MVGADLNFTNFHHLIETRAQADAHRVLVQACQSIGECSYARFEPAYVKSLHLLVSFIYRVPYVHGEESPRTQLKHKLCNDVVFYYRHMYAQPCLICDKCRNRLEPWLDFDMDDFENLVSEVDEELASEFRSPISVTTERRVPEWIIEWLHWMRQAGYWTPSRIGSRSQPIA